MKTTASKLLELVFEGHQIRTWLQGAKIEFDRNAVAKACAFTNVQKAIRRHVQPCDLGCIKIQVRSANGTVQNREISTLTQSGVLALVIHSNKPAARRFQRYLIDEVIPQLLKYGTFIPGATAGERNHALYTRWKQERAQDLAIHSAAYQHSGLLTIAAFRKAEPVPGEDPLLLTHHLRALAREQSYEPQRYFTGPRSHTPAWPRELLTAARRRANGTLFLRF